MSVATLMAKCKISDIRTVEFPVPLGENGLVGPPEHMPIWLNDKSGSRIYHLVMDHWDAQTDLVWYTVQRIEV